MWETAKQFNVGLDMGFFNNRVSGTLEYYQINTGNLLLQFSTPAYSGYTSQWRNAGEIVNRGVEFTLNTTNIRTRDFQWETLLTVSHNKNKWKDRAGLPKPYIGASEDDPCKCYFTVTLTTVSGRKAMILRIVHSRILYQEISVTKI